MIWSKSCGYSCDLSSPMALIIAAGRNARPSSPWPPNSFVKQRVPCLGGPSPHFLPVVPLSFPPLRCKSLLTGKEVLPPLFPLSRRWLVRWPRNRRICRWLLRCFPNVGSPEPCISGKDLFLHCRQGGAGILDGNIVVCTGEYSNKYSWTPSLLWFVCPLYSTIKQRVDH